MASQRSTLPAPPLAARSDALRALLRLCVVVGATLAVVWLARAQTPTALMPPAAPTALSAPAAVIREPALDRLLPGEALPVLAPLPEGLPRPPEEAEPERPARFLRFVVQRGDTLYDISLVYGVEMEDILRFNPRLGDGTRLEVGQVVLVPQFRGR